ncbi:MAG: S-layer homology domain-containing protein [Ruminococcaceae bacterium]|nr:S-layer homology domain-containing protein [Oscillospiraceae bacterium]
MKKVLSVFIAVLMIMSVFSIVGYAYTNIEFISLKGVTAPTVGAKPVYDADTNNAENFRIYYEYAPVGEKTYNGVVWYDVTTSNLLDKDDVFQAGHQYSVTVYLIRVGSDNMFPAYHIADVAEYVNGKEAEGDFIDTSLWEGGYSPTYYVSYTFPFLEESIDSITVTGVTAPSVGAKPAYKATVASSEPYVVTPAYDSSTIQNGVEWYDVTAKKAIKPTDSFAKGHSYSVTVYLRSMGSGAFPRIFTGTATINGKSSEAAPADPLATADYLQDFTVYYVFPALPDDSSDVTFPDVSKGAWYYEAATYCGNKGYINGYQDGRFGPNDPLQRQDFVVILANIANADLSSYSSCSLTDVQMNSYYGKAVAWAVDQGIIAGYQNGKFGVGDPINREQVATILYRFKGSPTMTGIDSLLSKFPDKGSISEFAKAPIAWAVQNGVISGMQDGRVAPKDTAVRAQIAAIIMNMDKAGMFYV